MQDEESLLEIVRLVGIDSLSQRDRIKLHVAQMIREDFLHQNAFHEIDTYTSLGKQYRMLELILTWFNSANEALHQGAEYRKMENLSVNEKIGHAKYVNEEDYATHYDALLNEIKESFKALTEV